MKRKNQILVTGFLFGLGDFIAQKISSRGGSSVDDTSSSSNTSSSVDGITRSSTSSTKSESNKSRFTSNVIKEMDNYDYYRTLRMTTYGLLVAGPLMVAWYKFLSSKFPLVSHRVIVDQLLAAPTSVFLFFSVNGILEQKTVGEIRGRLETEYWPVLKANYMVWPLVQVVNFRFVPVYGQTIFVGGLAVGWNAFLSLRNNNS